ncbi:MAG: 6-carboxytetrahydropterin synthase QueD [Selenomonadaceae bacterium]|nr:6-carboxytetrahydropterin synthase QueD [Selenomonadaceae bacterium]MBR1730803.1 6-carboxytetrahydropterin synthase QueD [Selenomonadaceae bacterium]
MFELTVKAEFEAAHQINGYNGKCQRLHGHNWSVEAIVEGRELDELGMLIDFKILKSELNSVLDELDHRYLNELEIFAKKNPTAENLAQIIFEKLSASEIFSKSKSKLKAIRVYESPKSCVTYTND